MEFDNLVWVAPVVAAAAKAWHDWLQYRIEMRKLDQ